VRVTDLRSLRREMNLTQLALADALSIPVNTLRVWDIGLRRTPDAVVNGARALAIEHRRQRELLPVPKLAAELGIHKSTLEAAIRTGRITGPLFNALRVRTTDSFCGTRRWRAVQADNLWTSPRTRSLRAALTGPGRLS
jgi:DNA-binding transcriptional regulator YiaG